MNLILFQIANMVTGMGQVGAIDYVANPELAFLKPILDALKLILTPMLILVATAGTIYAVVLGVNMARAETADKREEAKKRIINAIMALVITIALILLLRLFEQNIDSWLGAE